MIAGRPFGRPAAIFALWASDMRKRARYVPSARDMFAYATTERNDKNRLKALYGDQAVFVMNYASRVNCPADVK